MASWIRFMAARWLLSRITFQLSVVRSGWSSPCKRWEPSSDAASKSSRGQTANTDVHCPGWADQVVGMVRARSFCLRSSKA